MDWNIPDWKFPVINTKNESHYQMINENEREKIMALLKNNILNIGIPFLNTISDWENAAHILIEKEWFHAKACDFFLIADNTEKALWALQQGLDYWIKHPKASFPQEKEEINIRLKKYFNQELSLII